jgi:Ca-activated chloride channel family protein
VGALTTSSLMEDLSVWGQGQYYQVIDSYGLPEVVLKQPSTMKLPAYKNGLFAVSVRGGGGWWGHIDRRAVPELSGYVETTARPGAEVLMEIKANGHPLLATWQYGLGRVTAFMTEPIGDGTANWQNWREYGRLLGRVATRTADSGRAFQFAIEREHNHVRLTARQLTPAPGIVPQAYVVGSDGRRGARVQLHSLTPGLFAGEIPAPASEAVRVEAEGVNVTGERGFQPVTRLVSVAHEDTAPELQVDPESALDLAALSSVTSSTGIAFSEQPTGKSLDLTRLWPYCLLLALLLYLGELTYRRYSF